MTQLIRLCLSLLKVRIALSDVDMTVLYKLVSNLDTLKLS